MADSPSTIRVITDTAELNAVCADLADRKFVAVDTEFMRENTFWARLCLIQLAAPDLAVIVDPLAPDLQLDAFYELMGDPGLTKVFHAARQDIEIFVRQSGFVPAPLFDTQIAAMVAGFGDQVSYDQLVQRITGNQIDKSSRFTDWSRRPLSGKQMSYALSDVTHLRDVYQFLKDNLREQDRTDWVAEELGVLSSEETYHAHPNQAWQRLKMRVRKPRQLAVLKEVAAWRERVAQDRDVPRRRVLKDDAVYEIALQQPEDKQALGRLRSVPKGFERSSAAAGILKAVSAGMAVPDGELAPIPRSKPAPERAGAVCELLKVLLKQIAEQHGVAARIIATVDELDKIAADDDADVPALRGWRRDLFGEKALALKRGKLALAISEDGVTTLDIAQYAMAAE